ncbi:hypothetical protein BUALT_Bualt03G0085600 [Buddleja alternifolia]|uniref:F-box domain-containing protein n=1 Tax=Buddleja alternifolia TaxID=168488 RepID=A0AAV6XS42_9LAMI|nr:hypothetical protein BUALT_Bualt03G0085600 [Buddleja alternifolia]
MAIIPAELIEDILRRLPVKTLKRFRAVSKTWCFLIDSERFIKLHFRHSLITNSHRNLILGGLALYAVDLDSLDKAHVIKPPFYYKSVDSISNSCNGIVLVMSEPPVLWNPFSRSYKVLPNTCVESPPAADLEESYSRTTYGFGYDSRNDDYKVVKVVEYRNTETHIWLSSEAKIYGLKSNSWRTIKSFPYSLPFLRGHWRVLVNGALHTLAGGSPGDVHGARIMGFSVESEEHYEVKMPYGIQIWKVDLSLDVIEGRLAMICATRSRVVMWVMKEYGVKESWMKLLTIAPPAIEKHDIMKPLVYSKEGDKVLLNCDDKKLIWYDLKKRTVEDVTVDGQPFVFYAEPCIQSLISLDGPSGVKKQGKEKEKSKARKMIRRNKRLSSSILNISLLPVCYIYIYIYICMF